MLQNLKNLNKFAQNPPSNNLMKLHMRNHKEISGTEPCRDMELKSGNKLFELTYLLNR